MNEPPVTRHVPGDPPVVTQPLPAQAQPVSTSATHPGANQRGPATQQQSTLGRLIDKRWVVLLTLFGATAALGIPLIWRCRGIATRREKWFWTVAITIYTVVILWIFAMVMWWSYTSIRESLGW